MPEKIADVVIQDLKQFIDERGKVMHMIRADSPLFDEFGEVYFSMVNPGKIKAWKKHKQMTQRYAVPVGKIQLVIYDDRSDSASSGVLEQIFIGEDEYRLVQIPPGVWYGFKGISNIPALVANCTNLPHHPEEAQNCDPDASDIPFSWEAAE